MYTLITIGLKPIGKIKINRKEKQIKEILILDKDSLELNFPGISSSNFNYLKLESIMKYYMDYEESDKTLSDILDEINEKGFFSTIKPGLKIEVTEES